MDPRACLLDACDAIEDELPDTASRYLTNYADWRARGGFEPESVTHPKFAPNGMRGDELADAIRDAIDEADAR